jgi:hypothetical protein
VNDHPDTPYDDTRPDPPAGVGRWFLVRADNGCKGTYGDSGEVPDPRDLLDAASPCP